MNFLDELNPVQRQAAEATEGPVMIIAGAGSGKTRVLTYRIAHLLSKGVDPFNILSLTFTNKAAREMKNRIGKLVGEHQAKALWMGTFHSVFAKILRFESEKLGYPRNFTIYDTEDSKKLIKEILSDFNLDEKVYKPSLVLNRISSAKNNLISVKQYLLNPIAQEEDRASQKPLMGKIFEAYDKRCFKAGAMDFDDLLFKTNVLMRDFPEVLIKYQDKFRYILVDEYQDTNFSQYVIVKQLAARFQNICVVGDDAQSIYAFRGANIQNILNFEKDYPDLKTFKLEQNYRSTQTIVNVANKVIANNKDQFKKNVWTSNDEGENIKVLEASNHFEEGTIVVNSIFETKMNFQSANSDFAILYRTNTQSRAFEESLRKLNIPYRIYGGLSFYQRKEVKDLIGYFRLAINNFDDESLKRVINYPTRGIGQTTVDKIRVVAAEHDISIWTVIENIKDFNLGLNSGSISKINEFVTMIKSFSLAIPYTDAFEMANQIATSSGIFKDLYSDKTPEGVIRYENIQELLNGVRGFVDNVRSQLEQELKENIVADNNNNLVDLFAEKADSNIRTLDEFMQDIALLTDVDKKDENDKDLDKVSLMTIHAAKGLEFPYVYIVGLEENLFPSQMSLGSRQDLEEERRLFYVALTRAEKKATLTYAKKRLRFKDVITCERSRFIDELDAKYVDFPAELSNSAFSDNVFDRHYDENEADTKINFKKQPSKPILKPKLNLTPLKKQTNIQSTPIDTEVIKSLKEGSLVEHEKFGQGKVVFIEGVFPNLKATVQFGAAGQKQLLLKYAKLKVVG